MSRELPEGVRISPLAMNLDSRGSLTEIFRTEWIDGPGPCQWNLAKSAANVLRGVHVHFKHDDYMVVISGRLSVGLYDARPKSPTYRQSAIFEFSAEPTSALRIPIGVMHGFYMHEPTTYVYGVNSYYDPDDELGCYWADPALGIAWPCRDPLLSERDREPPSFGATHARLLALNPSLA
jgi:dTDP-4-dehydrorhamnose 3,5-epimerase